MKGVKALLFDVFGTAVDWRTTVTRSLHTHCNRTMYLADECSMTSTTRAKADAMTEPDWGDFAHQWRAMYYRFTREVAAASEEGKEVYKTIDEFQLESLKELLERWDLKGLWKESTIFEISRVWHRLDPWPDSVEGIRALNAAGLQTCTLSNGNVELLTDMAEHAKLEWTHILSAEMFQSYKPNPRVYLGAAEKLGLQPEECAMVAAHLSDLDAARKLGLRTVYVERRQEESWEPEAAQTAREWVDVWVPLDADGFSSVAQELASSRD